MTKENRLGGKTLFITGASRGIGLAIAARAAADGANIVIAAKTDAVNPKLEGTIYSAAEMIRGAGGRALPVVCDVRQEDQIARAFQLAVSEFGAIDILVNNASAIFLSPTVDTGSKQYSLMHEINARGSFLCTKYAIPHLARSKNPHILTMSPPLLHMQKWMSVFPAYAASKYLMSMYTAAWANELKVLGIAANSLWPETLIATAAVRNMPGAEDKIKGSRHPRIVADASYEILSSPAAECSGNFFIDTQVLKNAGVIDFEQYATERWHPLHRDIFLD